MINIQKSKTDNLDVKLKRKQVKTDRNLVKIIKKSISKNYGINQFNDHGKKHRMNK